MGYLKSTKINSQAKDKSFQFKRRIRRMYNPDDIDIAKLFLVIREHRTGNPQLDKTNAIKELLTQVDNINDIDYNDNGNTPLHVAVSKRHLDIVKLLLSTRDINPKAKNNRGQTPLDVINEDLNSKSKTSLDQDIIQELQGASSLKRENIGENKPEVGSPKKLRISSIKKEEPEGTKIEEGDPRTYPASGLKSTLHGVIYQLKLLMLFLKRGLDQGYSFYLATEWDDAEKFDDLVFIYGDSREKKCRFLQAKHKLDEKSNKITVGDLFTKSKDGEFNLEKYFVSYLRIKKKKEFKDYSLKDFIVCTNISFDLDNSVQDQIKKLKEVSLGKNKGKKVLVEEIGENDSFFKAATGTRYRIKCNDDLVLHLTQGSEVQNEMRGQSVDIIGKEIKEFLEKLVFAVDQPNEGQLTEILEHEISIEFSKRFDYIGNLSKDAYNKFEERMLGWLKERQGRFFGNKEAGDLFKEMQQEVNTLSIIERGVKNIEQKVSEVHLLLQGAEKGVEVMSQAYSISGNLKTINFNAVDYNQNTPLHLAAKRGYLDVVKCLIENGANLNAVDYNQNTPLHLAAEGGDLDVVEYLIKNNANLDAENKNKNTPLHLAAEGGYLSVVEYLIENNANLNAENKNKDTPLHLAAEGGDLDVVEYLIKNNANLNAENKNKNTPLHLAAEGGYLSVVEYLKKNNANLNAENKNKNTPLHLAAKRGYLSVVEYLKKNGADLNVVDYDKNTPLHFAAGGGYLDVVKCLIEKGDGVGVRNYENLTPLDLAMKRFDQNPQIYKGIIDVLKSKSTNLKRKNDNMYQVGEVSAEECLPSTSKYSTRKIREVGGKECLFTWEDVDEFNVEKGEKRDFNKIEIDSEKFVDYVKDLPEEKRSQLIHLAGEVRVKGRSQGLVNRLISNQKIMSYLAVVGRISGIAMHGMMAKNILADFLNGDYQGVAVNVGFIAGGQGFAKIAEATSLKGLKLASEGKLLLGSSLRAASPFLSRSTSAFVIYDLVNQVKAFKNGTEEALVGVVGDSIYLGVDAAEIGIEVAEAFELLEGVSSAAGPIGTTIGAVVFVGTDIYMAVKRVDKIDEIIHLTASEKFVEGLHAFIGMEPEKYIKDLMEEKQLNNQLVNQGLEYLQQHSDIKRYIFPTGKQVTDSCSLVPYDATECVRILGLDGGRCLERRTVTKYYQKCTSKFQVDLNNEVLLDRKRTDIKWSRARSDNPNGGKVFCLSQGDYEPVNEAYLCKNTIGITDLSRNKTGNHTLINLGKGNDHAKGFIDSSNVFVVNDGFKRYYGGNKDDIFILQGSAITGYFYGESGVNTLDLTSFAREEESMNVRLDVGEVEDYYRENFFGMSGINKFLGRKDKADQVFITCDSGTSDINFVDGQSGSEGFVDHINIYDKDCAYEMQVVVRPNTVIYNRALKGDFHYIIPYALGSAKVDFIYTAEALNLNNTFAFEYEPAQIKNIDARNINVLNKTSHIITFNFAPMSDKEFNITISGASNPSYRLGNNAEIKVGDSGNLYMLENTNKSVDEIIKEYLVVANRLNKMSFFIQSLLSNETVVIGSGNHEVIHNNPLHKSHLVGNGGENVYVIDSTDKKLEVPEVVIYDLDVESSVDTIDLRSLVQKARGKLSNKESFELKIIKLANDLLLKGEITELKKTEDSFVSGIKKHECFTVRLKDGVNLYNKTHIILNNVPMGINFDNNEWSLKPLPLVFERDKEIIIVTSQDIEVNAVLITPKRAGNYKFLSNNGNDLVITNAFDANVDKNDPCTIVLSKFYETSKMETLSIKFADKEINLKDHQEQINTARDINVVKKEYNDQVYNDVFNKKRSPEVMLSDQPKLIHKHRHEHSRKQTRHRRHHRNEQNLSHAVEELSNQRNIAVSSSTRLSSRINDLFVWVKSSIGGLLNSKPTLSKETSSTSSPISQIDAKMDVNGTIMLLDMLIRKVTGQKYVSTVDQSISPLEAQGYALSITEGFEKVVEQAGLKSGVSMHRLNIDYMGMQKEITGKIMSGKFNEISGILKSYVEKACPGEEAGKLSPKKFEKFIAQFNKGLLNQSIEQILHNRDGTLEVDDAKQMSLEPQSYLSNASVHSHSKVSTCLSEMGVTKLGNTLGK